MTPIGSFTAVDLAKPAGDNWKEVVPTREGPIPGGRLFEWGQNDFFLTIVSLGQTGGAHRLAARTAKPETAARARKAA